jgi:hypothetical protein
MTAAEFSQRLQDIACQRSLDGHPELTCLRRTDRSIIPHPDPLADLIANYDTSTFASHGIDFHIAPRDYRGQLALGTYHGDVVAVDPAAGAVRLIEWGTDHVLGQVAATTAQFLDALAIAVEFAADCLANDSLWEDSTTKRRFATRCATAAGGGDLYQPFYQMLLGCE